MFYCINNSLDTKKVGTYPQVEKAVYHCSIDDPKFIGNTYFAEIDFEPIVANAVLKKKAKLTDLISAGIAGFNLKLLVSDKLKMIITESRVSGLQFYECPIIHKDNEVDGYWILNVYEIDMKFIDFKKSEIYLTQHVFNNVERLNILSYEDFLKEKNKIEVLGYPNGIRIERIALLNNLNQDFFVLTDVGGGAKYVVSETLKKIMEDAKCTGIEFMPVELTINEWLHGEREKVYGKA